MSSFRIGFQMHPQVTSMTDIREAARRADELGADTIWVWDHFFPLYDQASGERYFDPGTQEQGKPYPAYDDRLNAHFEAWTTLSAIGADTSRAHVGTLVSSTHYRNPELLVDMARTLDHITGGRAILGVGAGWFKRDYDEYGYTYGPGVERLRDLEANIGRMKARLAQLNPQPVGALPLMIGGSGEQVTLRIVAQHADLWNGFGPASEFARRNAILDDHCADVGRDPSEVERTVLIGPHEVEAHEDFLGAGATHLILSSPPPFDTTPLARLVALRG
ncbi:MAG TPA: LLM class F420-dependent oxidoreductase [Nitriliruptorales bacterium]